MKHMRTIEEQVEACRAGKHPRRVARLESGWVVMGPSQALPGYCLLLADPVAPSLNALPPAARAAFLRDMTLLGDAIAEVQSPRRVNYEILGNLDPALHAHVFPRFEEEPDDMRPKPVWLYDPAHWNHKSCAYSATKHAALRGRIAAELARHSRGVVADTAGAGAGADIGLWQRASAYAAAMHEGAYRRDGQTPYMSHCWRVAMTVRDVFGCDDPVCLAAALLHDLIEDTGADYDEISERFGDDVATIVALLTKDMRLPEDRREAAYDEGLRDGDRRARLLKLADVFDNMTDTADAPAAIRRKMRSRCRRALDVLHDDDRADPCIARAAAAVEELLETSNAAARSGARTRRRRRHAPPS
ncbi:MAG: HD domain-containing protein [Phycisphaerales bacterium]|nr:MAG: HD domain-containing protein [Phycisphaerales bacterium]